MNRFTVAEKIDMIYGEVHKNIKREARDLYTERYHERRQPSRRTFYRIVQLFSETGSVATKKYRTRTVTGENSEIAVLTVVACNPHVSSRQIERDSGISRRNVLRILKRHKFHPYHISLHQVS